MLSCDVAFSNLARTFDFVCTSHHATFFEANSDRVLSHCQHTMSEHRTVCNRSAILIKGAKPVPSTHPATHQENHTAMTSRGDLQKQLALIMGVVNAQGLKFEDVMPNEMLDHFQGMTELKEARAYIKEVEAREKDLHLDNARLLEQLQTKQAEIDDQPADFKSIKVELQQSQSRIEFYQQMAEHEQTRAERCERRMEEAIKLQAVADADGRKIQRLDQILAACEARTAKLLEKNRTMAERYEAQQEQHRKVLAEKEDKLFDLTDRINQLEEENLQTLENSEQVTEAYDSLLNNIEQESLTATEIINSKSATLEVERRSNDQIYSAIASELAPLSRFFGHAFSALGICQSILQDLSSQRPHTVTSIPNSLEAELDSANDQLYAYQTLVADLRTHFLAEKRGGLAQEEIVRQVDVMANVAARMYTSLDALREDVSGLLVPIHKSNMLSPATIYRADSGQSGVSIPTQRSASSRSSTSSFASFTKRFSTASG
jgi:DNA repair exonuclease SbcCD ATPase subunit